MIEEKQENHFVINAPYVVHETIEGETIVMNLKNGYYYSFDGLGPVIWELILQGATSAQMVRMIVEVFTEATIDVRDVVVTFLDELKSHDIVSSKSDDAFHATKLNASQFGQSTLVAEVECRPPRFHRYTDMRDVLLLDPIHDVDEKGWPEPKVKQYKGGVPELD